MGKYTQGRPIAVCDTECMPNFWCVGFKTRDGRKRVFEKYNDGFLDRRGIAKILRQYQIQTFNGVAYDLPMILLAMSGASNEELKAGNDALIVLHVPWWKFLDKHGLTIPDFVDHVDLMQPSPGSPTWPSLKLYGGRLHSRKIQESPISFADTLTDVTRPVLLAYHDNDLDTTLDFSDELKEQIRLRSIMSDEYKVDVRSKSDAQVAEAVIKAEIQRAVGHNVYAPEIEPGFFNYKIPAWCQFDSLRMQAVVGMLQTSRFQIGYDGIVRAPDGLKSLDVHLGRSVYRMGLGGLHSQEQSVSYKTDDNFVIKDRDVTSYYPMSILLQRMFPKHLGELFLKIYKKIFDRRVASKKAGDKNTAETLKIVLNGVFGKLGSPYSIFYSPDLMVQVTLSGQLAILMLIERLERAGISVISGNTDGIVSKVPRDLVGTFNAVVTEWEWDTEYVTEETEYKALYLRDVNDYIAFGADGKVKTKGAYGASGRGLPGAAGLKKNPNMDICTDAVIAYLKDGTPIEDTIEWCADVRKFVVVQRVNKGGAYDQDGFPVGSALRWYHSKEVRGPMTRVDSGKNVSGSDGAKLMMTLADDVPPDLDFDFYIREAYAILQDLGVSGIDPRLRGRTGTMLARLPDYKSVHVVNAQTGVAICGKQRESIRDSWIECEISDTNRMCHKCKKADQL